MKPWNPAHFGEVPRQMEPTGQLTIFWEDSLEPPDPDDCKTLEEYYRLWSKWLKQNSWYKQNSPKRKPKG